ncbi:hypothetical protein A2U01_0096588, partial [Trifolium medium]|nr:hypothetical protein [Trifolium medium]
MCPTTTLLVEASGGCTVPISHHHLPVPAFLV